MLRPRPGRGCCFRFPLFLRFLPSVPADVSWGRVRGLLSTRWLERPTGVGPRTTRPAGRSSGRSAGSLETRPLGGLLPPGAVRSGSRTREGFPTRRRVRRPRREGRWSVGRAPLPAEPPRSPAHRGGSRARTARSRAHAALRRVQLLRSDVFSSQVQRSVSKLWILNNSCLPVPYQLSFQRMFPDNCDEFFKQLLAKKIF